MKRKRSFSRQLSILLLVTFTSLLLNGCKPDLEKLYENRDVAGLLDALKSGNEDVRWTAARYLGDLGDGRAIKPLIRLIDQDDSVQVRNSAIDALQNIDDYPALAALLADEDYRVASYASTLLKAAESIGDIDADQLFSLLQEHEDRAILIAPVLVKIGDSRAVELLIKLLEDENDYIRKEAAVELGKISGLQGVDALVTALDDSDKYVSQAAYNALVESVDDQSVEQLIALLESQNSYTRQYAVELLGLLGDARALAPLKKARVDEPYEMQAVYSQSIEMIGEELDKALSPLLTIFNTENLVLDPPEALQPSSKGWQSIATALAPVVQGEGVPGAAGYDRNKDGTPKLVVLRGDGRPHYINDYLNYDLLPGSVSETELVVGVEERRVILGEQGYYFLVEQAGYTVERIRNESDVTVREALSGDILLKRTYKGTEPREFPSKLDQDVREIVGSQVGFNELWDNFFCGEGFENLPCPSSWKIEDADDVKSIALSPDGQVIAISLNDIQIRRALDGELLTTLEVWSTSMVFSPDGQILASVGTDGVVRFFRASDWELLNTIDLHDYSDANDARIAFSPDGQFLAVAPIRNNGSFLYILRVADGEIIDKSSDIDADFEEVRCISFTPDGHHLVLGMSNGSVVIWNIGAEYLTPYSFLLHEDDQLLDLTFSPDGQYMALIDDFGYVWILRVSDGTLVYKRFHGIYETKGTGNISFLSDRRVMVSASYLGSIYQWEIQDFISK